MSHTLERKACVPLHGRSGVLGDLAQCVFWTNLWCSFMSGTIYEYGALTIDGEEYIPFKQYAGKYILFVNVASY